MRLLLVEDDAQQARFIIKGLTEAGYAVDHASDGQEGLRFALSDVYDVLIIDIMLPVLDGLTLIETIRKAKITCPILVLSARQSVDDRIAGLRRGGDDYLIKPFAFAELLARLQALLRRGEIRQHKPTKLTVGDLELDLLSREAKRSGTSIALQNKEFALLEYLMRNQGRVVSKTMIMEHVWNFHFDPQTNVVEVRMSRLRDKVDKSFATKLIHTIRGAGYVIRSQD